LKLAGKVAGTGLLDLPGDLLQVIADKASVDAHHHWVALWHTCRRLGWLDMFKEDAPEEGFAGEQLRWLQSRQEGTWRGKPFPCP
jgi:hypothetical protein